MEFELWNPNLAFPPFLSLAVCPAFYHWYFFSSFPLYMNICAHVNLLCRNSFRAGISNACKLNWENIFRLFKVKYLKLNEKEFFGNIKS